MVLKSGTYIKLKADENLISPVCSESVESLLQIYGFFLILKEKEGKKNHSRLKKFGYQFIQAADGTVDPFSLTRIGKAIP